MAFFGLFGKKREKEPEPDIHADLGLPKHDDLGLENNPVPTDDLAVPIENQNLGQGNMQNFPSENTFTQSSLNRQEALDKRDVELIMNKLDLINSRIETLSERLTNLERYMTTDQRKRW